MGVEARVRAVARQQLLVRALLDHAAVLQHEDAVRLTDGAQAVGDHDRGLAAGQAPKRTQQQRLGSRVHRAGGLVEDQDRGLGQPRAHEAHDLPLALGEIGTSLAHDGQQPVGLNFGRGNAKRGLGPRKAKTLQKLRDDGQVLAEVRAESERERLQIRLARKAYYPDITLGVDYINTGNALMAGTPDDSKDPLIARLSINLPLWRGAYAGKVKAAEAAYATQLQVQQVRENELLARLEVAYYSYRDNLRQEQLYRNTLLPRAEDAYAVLETLFATGSAPFSELIASYQRKLEFSLTLQRIRTDRFTRLAELGYLCGDEVVGWGD